MSSSGSPSPGGTNRLASSLVNTARSAAVYRLRSSIDAPVGAPGGSGSARAGVSVGSGSARAGVSVGSAPARAGVSVGSESARAGVSGLVTDLSPVLVGLPDPDRPQQPVRKLRL